MDSERSRAPASLADLFRAAGELHSGHGADPVDLGREDRIWLVERGAADVFVVQEEDGEIVAPLKHVLRAQAGECLFGVAPSETGHLRIRAKLAPGTVLHSAKRGKWLAAEPDLVADRVDAWLEGMSLTMARDVVAPRRSDRLLHPGESLDADEETVFSAARGIVWVKTGGQAVFIYTHHLAEQTAPRIPVSARTWVRTLGEYRTDARSSRDLMARGRLFDALAAFHRLFVDTEQFNRMMATVDTANLQMERTELRRRKAERAHAELASTVDSRFRPARDSESELMAALEAVGRREGIRFRLPQGEGYRGGEDGESVSLSDILAASNIRARRVRLSSLPRWWRGSGGSLLARRAEDGAPVALIRGRFGGYRAVADGEPPARLDARRAGLIEDNAWAFSRPLPARATARALARLAAHGMGLDALRFFAAGLVAAVLSLAPAYAIRVFVDRGVPAQDPGLVLGAAAALVLLAAAGVTLSLYQSGALLRTDGRMAVRATAAVWDRVFRVPPGELRQFSAGDISQRAFVFQGLRDGVSGVLANAVLSGVFLVPALVVTYAFNPTIGWLSLGLGLFSLAAMTLIGVQQVEPHRRAHTANQSLSGNLYEFLNGIAKLRSAGAEDSVFSFWAHRYSRQKRAEIEQRKWSEWLHSMAGSLPIFASAMLFAIAAWVDRGVSVADFIAAYSAAMVLFATITRLAMAVESIAAAVPACQQVQPLLEARPRSAASGDLADLKGEIHFDRVSFQYPGTDAPVLKGISIHAQPGQFIGIVGESGAGKSTLLRLALALETPTSGSLYYDSHDVTLLNRRSLREQIGVVFQDATLLPGSVLQNIVGVSTDMALKDAWRAARMAAVEQDIREMPMGMYTGVGSGSTFFSGGQIQRILIAAALVRNPRILLLDEATNWLDTASQAAVMESIAGIAATRIVIAHRLSTIRSADRIYVLEGGRVAQSGTFDELMADDGTFRRLARRQMAEID